MRQAFHHSLRIGQTRPVKVVFTAFRNTLQADPLKLVAKKLQSSLAVEGELPEDGLAAYGDDGDDLMMALDRQIVNGLQGADAETVEAVFAQARDAAASAEELLVDDGRQPVEAEPEAVELNGNGANGHHANDSGSSQGLVLGGDHAAAVPVNGNGHPKTPEASQPSLFSWAEFMAEPPAMPTGRRRKAQTPALSLFEWALEQERAPPGAGH